MSLSRTRALPHRKAHKNNRLITLVLHGFTKGQVQHLKDDSLFYLKEPVLKIRTNTEEQSNKTVSNSVKQAILSVLGIRLRREKFRSKHTDLENVSLFHQYTCITAGLPTSDHIKLCEKFRQIKKRNELEQTILGISSMSVSCLRRTSPEIFPERTTRKYPKKKTKKKGFN